MVRLVKPQTLDRAWPIVAPMLADALSRNCRGYALRDVREMIESEEIMLWVVDDGADTVAALTVYPDDRAQAVTVWLMGGRNMEKWLDTATDALSRYARDVGYRAIMAHVRPGLAKILQGREWRHESTTVRLSWAD